MEDTRSRILEAAAELIRAQGVLALTLEAVAERAGVSKGGLLYHFPNKEALVQGLLEASLEAFEAELGRSGRPFAEAYVELGAEDTTGGLFRAFLAAAVLYPGLLETWRARARRWYAQAGGPGAKAALLATDALFFAKVLGLEVLSPEEEAQVRAQLLELAREGEAS